MLPFQRFSAAKTAAYVRLNISQIFFGARTV